MADSSSSRLISSNGFGMFMLGIALALGGAFASQSLAKAIVASRTTSSIKVKGTAEVDLTSEFAKWTSRVQVKAASLQEAYKILNTHIAALQLFLTQQGFVDTEYQLNAVTTNAVKAKDIKGNQTNKVESYELSQSITVDTKKVALVPKAARTVTTLISSGIDVSSDSPQYLLSNLETNKVDLLDKATRNAMARAETLASGSGSSVGSLISASQGVIQILARGSDGSSEYGQYDTSTIDKTMRVVVSLEYAVR